MACKCADSVNKKLEEHGCRLARSLAIDFKSGKAGLSGPQLVLERVGNGKKKLPVVECSFCPFCGKKLPE